ncbi:hypothetical protein [Rhizobium binxianense]
MNDLETTVVITPAIPIGDMTPLERLVLSHVFDAGPTDEGLLLYSDRGAVSRLRFRADDLVNAYAASRHVAHSDINRIAARCWTLWCEEDEPGEVIDMDLTETSFEFMLRDIVVRSSLLSEIRVLEWYRHPSQNPDSFGVKIMLVTAVAIVGRSSDDLLEEMRNEAETHRSVGGARRSSDGPPMAKHAPALQQALDQAERFIAGFEGDELQEGVDQLLAAIRAAQQGRSDRQIVDETNGIARYIMAELIGTGYQVADGWKFYEEPDPRSRKAWKHAAAIMEMMTFTNADDALSSLDPDEQDPEGRFPIGDWQYEVANGDTRLGYRAWLEARCSE